MLGDVLKPQTTPPCMALAHYVVITMQTELDSFLIQISAEILAFKDPDGSGYLVDRILDKTGMKGTGMTPFNRRGQRNQGLQMLASAGNFLPARDYLLAPLCLATLRRCFTSNKFDLKGRESCMPERSLQRSQFAISRRKMDGATSCRAISCSANH